MPKSNHFRIRVEHGDFPIVDEPQNVDDFYCDEFMAVFSTASSDIENTMTAVSRIGGNKPLHFVREVILWGVWLTEYLIKRNPQLPIEQYFLGIVKILREEVVERLNEVYDTKNTTSKWN